MKLREPLPINPIPELPDWTRNLQAVAQRPLEVIPDFPERAARHEQWWRGELTRPLILATGPRSAERKITRRLELLDQPEKWLLAKQSDLRNTYFGGDSIASARVDFGPVMLGGLLGAKVEFQSDTTWTHAFLDDEWSNLPDLSIHDDNAWWRLMRKLTQMLSEDARGRYIVRTPDIGGATDLLLNFRGAEGLCMDVLERPDQLRETIDAIYPAWRKAFCELYRIACANGAGLIQWLELWSNVPYLVPQCDFNFMIGQAEFDSICQPDIVRQSETVGRAVFHVDGPGAAKHVESLLQVNSIQAIQFTPGEGTPSCIPWIDLFKQIQKRGRSLLAFCPLEEAYEVCRQLDPSNLALTVHGTPEAIDATVARISQYYGVRS